MKILGLIPARGGSKGIPGKNIRLLGGMPLLQYTYEAGRKSGKLSALILSSDDPEIIAVAKNIGLEVPFVRPAELSGDATTSLEVILHALESVEEKGEAYDAVCLLQPTTPFRREGLIDAAIEKFINGGYDSLVSVREVPAEFNPHWVFEQDGELLKVATGEEQIITRRQDLPRAYHRDGAIYLTRTKVLKGGSLYGNRIGFLDTTGSPYVNIDLPKDWEKAEALVKSLS